MLQEPRDLKFAKSMQMASSLATIKEAFTWKVIIILRGAFWSYISWSFSKNLKANHKLLDIFKLQLIETWALDVSMEYTTSLSLIIVIP